MRINQQSKRWTRFKHWFSQHIQFFSPGYERTCQTWYEELLRIFEK